MSLDANILLYIGNVCDTCGNTSRFFCDTINSEVVCLDCGIVVGRVYWRLTCYAKEES